MGIRGRNAFPTCPRCGTATRHTITEVGKDEDGLYANFRCRGDVEEDKPCLKVWSETIETEGDPDSIATSVV